MKLENIGFYTLNDERCKRASKSSPLYRCELILTDRCNFKCPYCRGLNNELKGDLPFEKAKYVIDLWIKNGLKNVRFSGGEPLLYKNLNELIKRCKDGGVERIAISSNGSFPLKQYEELISSGVNDFSISLDACCSSAGDLMSGVKGKWQRVIENIKSLSKLSYVTVGMVFTEDNIEMAKDAVLFANSLNISDIRIIPSAQYNKALISLSDLPAEITSKYPILSYRINNIKQGKHVRGITKNCKCWLALDDMCVVGDYHFPCIIYMRENGKPIGKINNDVREQRNGWVLKHNPIEDNICKNNCLDVCVEYCQRYEELRKGE